MDEEIESTAVDRRRCTNGGIARRPHQNRKCDLYLDDVDRADSGGSTSQMMKAMSPATPDTDGQWMIHDVVSLPHSLYTPTQQLFHAVGPSTG